MYTTTPTSRQNQWSLPSPRRVTVFVGNFGSGKTEIAINYALALKAFGQPVRLVDLDIVNPYFRSREARSFMTERGVDVVAPENEYAFADLPILLREVAGAIGRHEGHVVLDVGGDDLGARVLGGYATALSQTDTALLQVVNQRRPFTDSIEGCLRMYRDLEHASRMSITGLVANAHLMDETSEDVVRSGVEFTRRMGEQLAVPLEFAAIESSFVSSINIERLNCSVLALERFMTTPWELSQRRGPIGRPPQVALPAGVK